MVITVDIMVRKGIEKPINNKSLICLNKKQVDVMLILERYMQ